MIKVIVKSNGAAPRETTAEVNSTPASVFDDLGIDTSGAHVTMAGSTLGNKIAKSFEELGVSDGSTVTLQSIVKLDGANLR